MYLNRSVNFFREFASRPFVYLVDSFGILQGNFFASYLGTHVEDEIDYFIYLALSQFQGVDQHLLANFARTGFNHRDTAPVSRHHEVEFARRDPVLSRIHHEFSVDISDLDRSDGAVPRDVRYRERCGGRVYRQYVGRVHLVDR